MKLNIIKHLKVDELIVFASLPDMGTVGGLVSTFLTENLEGVIFRWMVKATLDINNIYIYYNESHKLLIFTGSSQPQGPMELYKLCNTFLDYVQETGKIISCMEQVVISTSN
jgi:uncharacterized protein